MEHVIKRAIAATGTARELARKLGITPQSIAQWREVPANRCRAVHKITGIPLHELRPDLYLAPEAD